MNHSFKIQNIIRLLTTLVLFHFNQKLDILIEFHNRVFVGKKPCVPLSFPERRKMSVLVLQIIRVQQFCQFLFVSREKEYERLGGWQGVCGRVARHLCSYHVRVWQCRTVGEHKIQTSKYKQSITKYKLQRNTNTCVLIMFGCGSVAQSVGATKY